LRLIAHFLRRAASFRRWKFHSGASGFGQTYSDGLLWRTRTMFSLADVFKFFANEFSSLSGWRFALFGIVTRTLDDIIFWHVQVLPTGSGPPISAKRWLN